MLAYASQFANAMANKHTVYVVLPTYSDTSLYSDNLWLLKPRAPSNIIFSIIQTLNIYQHYKLMKAIKKFNPDVVHILDNHPWYLYYAKKFKDKLFVTQHDPMLHEGDKKGFMRWLTNKVNVKLREWAKIVFVHGQKIKESITDIPQDKIEVIPHGDYSFFTKYQTQTDMPSGDVLFFGRLLPYKGWEDLFEAARDLEQYKFTIAGEGKIDRWRRNVTFINRYITNEETADLFRKHKIIILPYKDASQSGIIPIAYAFKKPVIVTDVGSLPETVLDGTTGIVIKPNSPHLLADAIQRLLKEDLGQVGENCYKFMQEHMSWDKITDKVIEVYNGRNT